MSLLKYILKEQSLSVNSVLDKINSQGMESLSPMELKFLEHEDKNNFIDDVLNSEFEGVENMNIKRKSFDKITEIMIFMNQEGDVLYEYDLNKKIFYIPDDNILFNFFKNEEAEVVNFLKSKYNIPIRKLERVFTNKE